MVSDSILKQIFSSQSFHRLLHNRKDDIFLEVVKQYISHPEEKTYAEIFSIIYNYISLSYRTEYYYKNKLLNKMVLFCRSSKNATAFQELPIGTSKADFVIVNRKGRVYEIKTELDNLDRLKSQLDNYYKAFSLVNVVTYKENIDKVWDQVPYTVGIIYLTKRGALKEIRKPVENTNLLDPNVMFDILRKDEYERIIFKEYGSLPSCDDFFYYRRCKDFFCDIDINKSQKYLIHVLKYRYSRDNDVFRKIPECVRLLAYFFKTDKKNIEDITSFLSEKYGG